VVWEGEHNSIGKSPGKGKRGNKDDVGILLELGVVHEYRGGDHSSAPVCFERNRL